MRNGLWLPIIPILYTCRVGIDLRCRGSKLHEQLGVLIISLYKMVKFLPNSLPTPASSGHQPVWLGGCPCHSVVDVVFCVVFARRHRKADHTGHCLPTSFHVEGFNYWQIYNNRFTTPDTTPVAMTAATPPQTLFTVICLRLRPFSVFTKDYYWKLPGSGEEQFVAILNCYNN